MKRLLRALVGVGALAVVVASGAVHAGKADDTLTWTTDRDAEIILPFYNNIRVTIESSVPSVLYIILRGGNNLGINIGPLSLPMNRKPRLRQTSRRPRS